MVKPIESLQRGLQVLQALIEGPTWRTLQELHVSTQIPKPTLLAILETLRDEDVAHKGTQGWAPTSAWLMGINAYALRRLYLMQLAKTHKEKTDERYSPPNTQAETEEPGGDIQAEDGARNTHKSEGG